MDWISEHSVPESLLLLEQLSKTCCDLGGPLTRSIYQLVEKHQWAEVVDFKFDYEADFSVNDFLYARQIHGFFSKYEKLPLGVDKRAVAIETFLSAEQKCRETNRILRFGHPPSQERGVEQVLYTAQRKIARILGDVPNFGDFNFCFGPGANTNVRGTHSSPRFKLGAPLVCSTELAITAGTFLEEVPHWVAAHAHTESETTWLVHVTTAPGVVTTVPKNAKTHRTIMIEPLLNSFFQKGIGQYVRQRLQLFGVDLQDQSRNQKLACQGSYTGSLATIDLSSASDTMSTGLVAMLLPLVWFNLLSRLRTGDAVMPDGSCLSLAKFSSMGNGFTFELESLIFYALAASCVEVLSLDQRDVSVYGDDIIVPVESYGLLKTVLEYVGFVLNTDKSYMSGPFRESCGADYLHGIDIRPYYQKDSVSGRTLFSLHNWCIRHGERDLAAAVVHCIAAPLRLYGPDGFGDGHLIGDFPYACPRRLRRLGWEGSVFETYSLKQKRSMRPSLCGDAVLPVYSIYTRDEGNSQCSHLDDGVVSDHHVVRGSTGYSKISIYTLKTSIF